MVSIYFNISMYKMSFILLFIIIIVEIIRFVILYRYMYIKMKFLFVKRDN